MKFLLVIIFIFNPIHFVNGKVFNNSYLSFEIPENWKCKSFGTDWVCHSTLSEKEKEAMIILTAKIAGSLDNLQSYESFLKRPREGLTKSKQPFQSKVVHSKKVFINSQPWVDGFHKESEIPSYYTRYIATVCCNNQPSKLGILVTYSAHVNHYTKYASDFLKSINSLRVLDVKKTISKMQDLGVGENLGAISEYMEDLIDGDLSGGEGMNESSFFGLSKSQFGFVLFLILVALMYAYLKSKKNKRRLRRKRRR